MRSLIIPNHVAIIMDGNGRWATARGLTRSMGHQEGAKNLEKIAIYILSKGVKNLSVFAFSTDNFKRKKEEVDFLMKLFIKFFTKNINKFKKNEIKVVFSGRKGSLSNELLKVMDKMENETKNNKKGTLNICLNYGGQEEIIDAFKKIHEDILNKKVNFDKIDREYFYKYLYQELPPIDYLIRTSGEYRISNFMIYQASLSEFYFTKTLFPDFDEKEFDKSLIEFNKRERRFGGNLNES